MIRSQIQTSEDMIEYLIDCTLATVESLCWAKRLRKYEFGRQCGIAQAGIDFLGNRRRYTSRPAKVVASGLSVQDFYTQQRERIQKEAFK